ncbi:MAG: DMT family transporter [Desulfobacteraceae bacterium]|nr:DMT family transporter [Desulfobacteraceae bacterium]
MSWILLSLATALSVATHDAWVKKYFSDLQPGTMMLYPMVYSLPLFLFTAFQVSKPTLDATFWWCIVLSVPINLVSLFLYMKAIRLSPLSLTIPYLALTPVFMIGTGYLFLREMPTTGGLLGIAATGLGGYILHIDPQRWSLFSPLAAVFREPGSWLMLVVAFLFSFGAVIGKLGILHSSPLFFTLWFLVALNLTTMLWFTLLGQVRWHTLSRRPLQGAVAGALLFAHAVCHGYAIEMTRAAYMISIKRLSILISVFYGGVFFREENMVFRFAGAACMVAGAVLIALAG